MRKRCAVYLGSVCAWTYYSAVGSTLLRTLNMRRIVRSIRRRQEIDRKEIAGEQNKTNTVPNK